MLDKSLLYDSYRNDSVMPPHTIRSLTLPVEFNGKKWVLYFAQTGEHAFYLEKQVLIVFFSGGIISILLLLLTISYLNTLHRSQQIRNQNKELLQLNSQKDKFFSIIAHDLKSPFNSIIGFSNLLVEQINEKDYAGIEKYAEIIQQSSERAMDLLMNLMEWSRSQTGRMEFSPEHFEMGNLINEVTPMFEDIAGQKSVSISKILPPKVPVFADEAMISTIMRNLISNAIKFSHPGGKINISIEEKPGRIKVSVADNGVGISEDSIDKLFRFDKNISTPGTQNEQGTGLGLILCKEFIEKHGGKIWVESEEGKGSVFYFNIPQNI